MCRPHSSGRCTGWESSCASVLRLMCVSEQFTCTLPVLYCYYTRFWTAYIPRSCTRERVLCIKIQSPPVTLGVTPYPRCLSQVLQWAAAKEFQPDGSTSRKASAHALLWWRCGWLQELSRGRRGLRAASRYAIVALRATFPQLRHPELCNTIIHDAHQRKEGADSHGACLKRGTRFSPMVLREQRERDVSRTSQWWG